MVTLLFGDLHADDDDDDNFDTRQYCTYNLRMPPVSGFLCTPTKASWTQPLQKRECTVHT